MWIGDKDKDKDSRLRSTPIGDDNDDGTEEGKLLSKENDDGWS